jgi:uncharacterized protein (TIGR02246 family)
MNDTDRTNAELEIRNVLARLAHMADCGDPDEYAELFAEDGSWYHPHYGEMKGRSAIADGIRARFERGSQGPGSHMRHVLTTQWVRVDDDHAYSQAYWITLRAEGTPALSNMGRYDDELCRTPEGWRMFRRNITLDTE